MTILRGQVAVENGELKIPLGTGQFLRRKVDPAVTNRPAC
jgi:glycerol kinase